MNILHRIRMLAITFRINRLIRANSRRRHVASSHLVSYPVPAKAEGFTAGYFALLAIAAVLVVTVNVTEQQPARSYACSTTLASK